MIESIETTVLWPGKQSGECWFHPKVARTPGGLLLTAQRLSASDVMHPLHYAESFDGGRSWTERRAVPGLERRVLGGGYEDVISDVVPEYHAPTGSVLCLGSDVHYFNEKLTKPFADRWIRYFARRADGTWTKPRKLEFDHPAATQTMSAGCGQRKTKANGNVLVPVFLGAERTDRAVTTLECSFDGEALRVLRHGRILHYAVRRGLLEPSLGWAGGRYWMTIRAEDERGYYTSSRDGLAWEDIRPYAFDDGTPLVTSTTQQHWIEHAGTLWLSYTRRDASNAHVFRWRTPTFLCQFDPVRRCLRRATERVATPMEGDAYHGNFHVTKVGPRETWLTQCDLLTTPVFRGDTMITRIRWKA